MQRAALPVIDRMHSPYRFALALLSLTACGGDHSPATSAAGGAGGVVASGGRNSPTGGQNSAAGAEQSRAGQSSAAMSGGGFGGSQAGGGVSAPAGGSQSGGAGGDGGLAGRGGGRGGRSGLAGAVNAGGAAGARAGTGGDGGSGARPTVTAEPGTTLVKVNAAVHHQTFEGFGTSLCWWANHVGGWSEAARNSVVDAIVNPTSGLGYNVFRYNIGGGENPAHEHMGDYREMPGFEPAAGTWDFTADANQRALLERITATGSGIVLEAFSNSPPYWMTKSGCASGSSDGSNNLKDDAYDDFADYLTEVVKHYRDEFGITFRTLEPLNEPNASWWKSNGSQEGCHFSPSNQETIIQAVAAKLVEKGLSETSVSASDENSLDDAYKNLGAFSSATLAVMSQMNSHSYAGSRRKELRALATKQGKRLWQSESGPLNQDISDATDAALYMAGLIITDLRDLGAEAWVDWQVGDPALSWASVTLDDKKQSFAPLKRFYMHAGFSRYIRPGSMFVDIDDANMVAARTPSGNAFVIVVRNGDASAEKKYTFDLTSLPSVGAAAEAHRTSRTEDLAAVPNVAIDGFRMVVTVPAYSVTTFVVPTGA
jgi:O-glycosyl hydrolase